MWRLLSNGGKWYARFPSHHTYGYSKLTDPITAYVSHHHPNMIRKDDCVDILELLGFDVTNYKQGMNDRFVATKLTLKQLINDNDPLVHSTVKGMYKKLLESN
jgi:hypothetical protein